MRERERDLKRETNINRSTQNGGGEVIVCFRVKRSCKHTNNDHQYSAPVKCECVRGRESLFVPGSSQDLKAHLKHFVIEY